MLFEKRIEHTLLYIYFFITITEAISMLVALLVAEGSTLLSSQWSDTEKV